MENTNQTIPRIHPIQKVSRHMEKKALGKGLGSLISSSTSSDKPKGNVTEVAVTDIIANPNQPRKLFDKGALDELASSIEEKGILQPLLVRPIGGGKYELIAGERRFRASQMVHLDHVPVVIKEIEDEEILELALIENIQREDLNPIEEALAYKDLLSRFQYTQDELAKRIGKDRSSIANALRLLKLPDQVRDFLIEGRLSMGHARALLAVEDRDLQSQMARDIIENQLSVREIEGLIKRLKEESPFAPKSKQEKANAPQHKEFQALAKKIRDHLKTPVQLSGEPQKGKLTINFHSETDLKRILEKLFS